MKLQIPSYLEKVKDVTLTKEQLISFESEVKQKYEDGDIPAPIHLSKDNEDELIEIFQYVHEDDWVFSAWRNHYHALLHGFDRQYLMDSIVEGRSMATSSNVNKFYSSAIVGGIIPIALGAAMALKRSGRTQRVWCFIGDMTFETVYFTSHINMQRILSYHFNLQLKIII